MFPANQEKKDDQIESNARLPREELQREEFNIAQVTDEQIEEKKPVKLQELPIVQREQQQASLQDPPVPVSACGPGGFFRQRDNILTIFTVLSIVLGCTTGILLRKANLDSRDILLISFPGVLFMNMLKMMTIPLVASSLISGITNLNNISSGKIGVITLIYYILTTFSAVILGIVLVISIHPGGRFKKTDEAIDRAAKSYKDMDVLHTMLDLIRNLIPDNMVEVCFRQSSTVVTKKNVTFTKPDNSTGFKVTEIYSLKSEEQTNAIGLVSVSIFLGIVIRRMGKQASLLVRIFSILNEAVMGMVKIVIWYSPIGIFFLVVGKILDVDNLSATLRSLGLYMATVTSGLVLHTCVTLTLAYLALTRKNPITFLRGLFQAWITALGTASSAATLPVTFRCLEENNKIDKTITRFVLPIGATVNMDGTALYEAVACIFIAQVNTVRLSPVDIFIISLTATLAAIGAASVPSAGVVTMVMVLSSVSLPTDDISLILSVDWLLDRLRTSVNVLGDAFGAGIIDHFCKVVPSDQSDDEFSLTTENQLPANRQIQRSHEEA